MFFLFYYWLDQRNGGMSRHWVLQVKDVSTKEKEERQGEKRKKEEEENHVLILHDSLARINFRRYTIGVFCKFLDFEKRELFLINILSAWPNHTCWDFFMPRACNGAHLF